MKLDDVLKAAPDAPVAHDHALVHLKGQVEKDHDPSYFRLYPNPHHRRAYLLVKKTDVVGDPYAWTAEEVRQAGFTGAKIHSVVVKIGTEVQSVAVRVYQVGYPNSGTGEPKSIGTWCCANGCGSGDCWCTTPGDCIGVGDEPCGSCELRKGKGTS